MMFLSTDEQTLKDLGIFDDRGADSIFDIYNHAHTRGGEDALKEMFRNPLSDKEEISRRSGITENLARLKVTFPFSASSFDMAEKYLAHSTSHSGGNPNHGIVLTEKEMQNGVGAVLEILKAAGSFIK